MLLGKLNGMLKVVCDFVVNKAFINKGSYNAWEGLIEKMMPLCKGMMTLTVQVKARDIDCVPQAVLAK